MALAPGTRLGPYEVLAPLGAGGMGEVYRARDTRLDRTVAIKVLAPDLASDGEFRQRFHAEARAISQLTHPHICTLHDIGEHVGTTFLVMELLTGETLADRLARGTPEQPALTLEQALQIGIQIADALAAAHAQGIVHRDLKPGNIMLTRAATPSAVPHAKLLDFGLAKSTPVVTGTGLSMAPTTPPQAVTAQGAIVGTIQYMAPEQVEGGTVDARTDIFALGSVLYELLTGRKAFEGKSQAGVMAAILEREPPPVSALQPRVPALVDATVQKCLAKQPEARWQSAADLATALRWATSGPALSASGADGTRSHATPSHGRRRFVLLGLWTAAALAAGAGLAWRYPLTSSPPSELVRFDLLPPPTANWSRLWRHRAVASLKSGSGHSTASRHGRSRAPTGRRSPSGPRTADPSRFSRTASSNVWISRVGRPRCWPTRRTAGADPGAPPGTSCSRRLPMVRFFASLRRGAP
jgi:serine/threonine protein kinase